MEFLRDAPSRWKRLRTADGELWGEFLFWGNLLGIWNSKSPLSSVSRQSFGERHITLGNFTTPIGQVKSPLFHRSSIKWPHRINQPTYTTRHADSSCTRHIFIFIHYNINNKQHTTTSNACKPNYTFNFVQM